ncbi:MAG: hypothetical protein KAX13_02185, partial [Candidatus Krumholzibacteria bacterium]|nr:hypothetical protein [Candidatus Krumholzibacteria bacterium]
MKDGFDWDSIERELFESADERWLDSVRAAKCRRRADRIASLILHSDMPPGKTLSLSRYRRAAYRCAG